MNEKEGPMPQHKLEHDKYIQVFNTSTYLSVESHASCWPHHQHCIQGRLIITLHRCVRLAQATAEFWLRRFKDNAILVDQQPMNDGAQVGVKLSACQRWSCMHA